jgi:hypothetical protein
MSDLLSAVQQCQVRYGGKSELATENEEVIFQSISFKIFNSIEEIFVSLYYVKRNQNIKNPFYMHCLLLAYTMLREIKI